MQVSVQSSGLERHLTVEVPAQQVEQEVEKRLRSMAGRVRIDGFRPGKVPFKVVEQRYGRQVRDEVHGDLVQSTFAQAATQERLRVAGSPEIELVAQAPGMALQYKARFEVYPEFEFVMPQGGTVDKPVVEITDVDVDNMLDRLRKQRMRWEPVQRPAGDGDRIIVDFKGIVDGEAFPGGEATDFPIVLGSKGLVPGFEEQLVGVQAGETRGIGIDFPVDYPAPNIAGKRAHFTVQITAVAESKVPEVDEEFAAGFGVTEGGVPALRNEIKATMARELQRVIKDRVKTQVMDALIAANSFTLPKTLVDEEIKRLREQVRQTMGPRQAMELEAQGGYYEARAQRRVALGLIIAEIVKSRQLKVAPDKLRAAVEDVASTYEVPSDVVQWYYSNRDRLSGVEAMLLEDNAVEYVLTGMQLQDVPTSYAALMAGEPEV